MKTILLLTFCFLAINLAQGATPFGQIISHGDDRISVQCTDIEDGASCVAGKVLLNDETLLSFEQADVDVRFRDASMNLTRQDPLFLSKVTTSLCRYPSIFTPVACIAIPAGFILDVTVALPVHYIRAVVKKIRDRRTKVITPALIAMFNANQAGEIFEVDRRTFRLLKRRMKVMDRRL